MADVLNFNNNAAGEYIYWTRDDTTIHIETLYGYAEKWLIVIFVPVKQQI